MRKQVEILGVKLLAERMECDYVAKEGDKEVVGKSHVNEKPTVKMLGALRDLSEALASVYYLGLKEEAWRREHVLATGFKIRYTKDGYKGVVLTGKIRLLSERWMGISTDLMPYDDNVYGITGISQSVDQICLLIRAYFFDEKHGTQSEIEGEEVINSDGDNL